MRKKMGAGGRKMGDSFRTKGARHGRRVTNSRPLAAAQAPWAVSSSKFFYYFIIFCFGLTRNFLAFWKNGCTTPPIF
jgi:hypothetical protein